MNPIVEIIARALFAAECESGVVGAWEGDRHRYVLADAARVELSNRDTIPAPPGEGEES